MSRDKSAPLSTVMGPGAHHHGDLSFEGRVRVDGHFTGRLYTEDCLEIGQQGLVEGECDVARAIVSGRLEGRIRIREHLLLHPTGSLKGTIDIGIAEIRPGARLEGQIRILGTEIP